MILELQVQPGAARAVNGKATRADVRILSGLKSRQKRVQIAVIIDYVKLDEAKGTWLESHFRWQIRTFWWGLLWSGLVLFLVLSAI